MLTEQDDRHHEQLYQTGFDEGWSCGKEKAHWEIRGWDGSHDISCGCEPCISINYIRSRLQLTLQPPTETFIAR